MCQWGGYSRRRGGPCGRSQRSVRGLNPPAVTVPVDVPKGSDWVCKALSAQRPAPADKVSALQAAFVPAPDRIGRGTEVPCIDGRCGAHTRSAVLRAQSSDPRVRMVGRKARVGVLTSKIRFRRQQACGRRVNFRSVPPICRLPITPPSTLITTHPHRTTLPSKLAHRPAGSPPAAAPDWQSSNRNNAISGLW